MANGIGDHRKLRTISRIEKDAMRLVSEKMKGGGDPKQVFFESRKKLLGFLNESAVLGANSWKIGKSEFGQKPERETWMTRRR